MCYEPVDDLRESSYFLLIAQWRAGIVPIFAKSFRYKVSISLLIYGTLLSCFFFSTSYFLAMVVSCIVSGVQSSPCRYYLQANFQPRKTVLVPYK